MQVLILVKIVGRFMNQFILSRIVTYFVLSVHLGICSFLSFYCSRNKLDPSSFDCNLLSLANKHLLFDLPYSFIFLHAKVSIVYPFSLEIIY